MDFFLAPICPLATWPCIMKTKFPASPAFIYWPLECRWKWWVLQFLKNAVQWKRWAPVCPALSQCLKCWSDNCTITWHPHGWWQGLMVIKPPYQPLKTDFAILFKQNKLLVFWIFLFFFKFPIIWSTSNFNSLSIWANSVTAGHYKMVIKFSIMLW